MTLEKPVAPVPVHSEGAEAGGVELVDEVLHGGGDGGGECVAALGGEFFVADAPEDDGGVVAVAADEAVELGEDFGGVADAAVFIQDEHSESVAGVEEFRGGIAVGHAPGIAAALLEFEDAVVLEAVGERDADAGEVLVVGGALDGDVFTVEEEAGVGVEFEGADAEGGFVGVEDGGAAVLVGADRGDEFVERRGVEGPKTCGRDGDCLRHGDGLLCGDLECVIFFGGWFSVGVGGDGSEGDVGGLGRVVLDVGAGGDGGVRAVDFGGDKGAPGGDMDGVGDGEPDVAVDAGTFVEPAFLAGGVDADDEFIFLAGEGVFGDVEVEAGVAAGVAAEAMAVEPDEGVAEDAVEGEGEGFSGVGGGEVEGAAVPADVGFPFGSEGFVAVVFVAFFVEGEFDGPVVGEVEGSPGGVVEGGGDDGEGFAEVGGGGVDLFGGEFGGEFFVVGTVLVEAVEFGVVELRAGAGGVFEFEMPVGVEEEFLAGGGEGVGGASECGEAE